MRGRLGIYRCDTLARCDRHIETLRVQLPAATREHRTDLWHDIDLVLEERARLALNSA